MSTVKLSPLSHQQARILAAMSAGLLLRGERTPPFRHEHKLIKAGVGETVSEATVGSLTKQGYIRGKVRDEKWDVIDYTLTEQGIAAGKELQSEFEQEFKR